MLYLDPFDEAEQQLPIGGDAVYETLYQFPGPVLLGDGAFLLTLQLFSLFLQLSAVHFDLLVDALEIRVREDAGQLIHVHLVQGGGQAVDFAL